MFYRSFARSSVTPVCLSLFMLIVIIFLSPLASGDVRSMGAGLTSLQTVPVGNVGNTGELSGTSAGGSGPDRICGAVGYEYNIGKYEVTTGQYTEFLNAVATTDTYGLYNTKMWSDYYDSTRIQRNGVSGSYAYSVAADWANRPVNYVSWGDAARFSNWMHNGQPTGTQTNSTTEDGAYFLNGATSEVDLMAVSRKTDAKWVIPTEDEWYKAAYHKNDGVTGNYWDYSTSSDTTPSNDLTTPDEGNIATFFNYPDDFTIGDPYYRTEVGEHENSPSPYGTFDQGGNIFEWNEAISDFRSLRGGGFKHLSTSMHASNRIGAELAYEIYYIGFRVAEVPEPATMGLLAIGGLALLRRKRGCGG